MVHPRCDNLLICCKSSICTFFSFSTYHLYTRFDSLANAVVLLRPDRCSLKSGGNPEAAGLPPSSPTMQFSGAAAAEGSLVKSRNAVVVALLLVIVSVTCM